MIVRFERELATLIANETDNYLTDGKEYLVYAISFDVRPAYYLADDRYSYYPRLYPADVFDIVEARVSRYWHLCLHQSQGMQQCCSELAPEDWCADSFFYDQLTDGCTEQLEMWINMKSRIEEEFDVKGPPQAYVPNPG